MDHTTQLYLITPPRLEAPVTFLNSLEAVLATGHVTALQLRLKETDGVTVDREALLLLAKDAVPIAQAAGVAVFINDAADIAAETGADGVHLGQEDGTVKEARTLLGPDAIIGVTCHDSRHLAMVAGEAGADYVAFGAFYPTTTKTVAYHAHPELLTWWQELMEIPCVAIGGITHQNAEPLARAGADFLAVSAGVWAHPDGPAAAVGIFQNLFDTCRATT